MDSKESRKELLPSSVPSFTITVKATTFKVQNNEYDTESTKEIYTQVFKDLDLQALVNFLNLEKKDMRK